MFLKLPKEGFLFSTLQLKTIGSNFPLIVFMLHDELFIYVYCSSASTKPTCSSVAHGEFCDLLLLINPVF